MNSAGGPLHPCSRPQRLADIRIGPNAPDHRNCDADRIPQACPPTSGRSAGIGRNCCSRPDRVGGNETLPDPSSSPGCCRKRRRRRNRCNPFFWRTFDAYTERPFSCFILIESGSHRINSRRFGYGVLADKACSCEHFPGNGCKLRLFLGIHSAYPHGCHVK